VLNMLADMKLPPLESFGAKGARDFLAEFMPPVLPAGRWARWSKARSPATTVRCLPSLSAGDARATSDRGVFPWRWLGVGDQQSDDPFCRDLCRRSGMIFVSVGYRHAPEHRFPQRQRMATRRRGGSPSMRPSSAADRER